MKAHMDVNQEPTEAIQGKREANKQKMETSHENMKPVRRRWIQQ
jgi:hypothetical protein